MCVVIFFSVFFLLVVSLVKTNSGKGHNMPFLPKNESVVKYEQLLKGQMENRSLKKAVVAASLTDKPYCCCFQTTVVDSFATLSEATAFRDSSYLLLTVARYAPATVSNA